MIGIILLAMLISSIRHKLTSIFPGLQCIFYNPDILVNKGANFLRTERNLLPCPCFQKFAQYEYPTTSFAAYAWSLLQTDQDFSWPQHIRVPENACRPTQETLPPNVDSNLAHTRTRPWLAPFHRVYWHNALPLAWTLHVPGIANPCPPHQNTA